jgi:hypothetical protein
MNRKICFYILLTSIFTLGCSNNESSRGDETLPNDKTEVSKSVALENANKLQTDTVADAATVSSDELQNDTIADNKQVDSSDKAKKYIKPDFEKTYKINLTLPQFEITDSKFYYILDSLNTLEKKCMGSEIHELHWTLNSFSDKVMELTMASGIGKGYKGYFYINKMLYLTSTDLSQVSRPTGKKKNFLFEGKSSIMVEDYSVYLFSKANNEVKIVKAYNLPCN